MSNLKIATLYLGVIPVTILEIPTRFFISFGVKIYVVPVSIHVIFHRHYPKTANFIEQDSKGKTITI